MDVKDLSDDDIKKGAGQLFIPDLAGLLRKEAELKMMPVLELNQIKQLIEKLTDLQKETEKTNKSIFTFTLVASVNSDAWRFATNKIITTIRLLQALI